MCLVSVVVRVYCSRLLGVVWSEKESPSFKRNVKRNGYLVYLNIFLYPR